MVGSDPDTDNMPSGLHDNGLGINILFVLVAVNL